jgi:hypothetical protein
MSKASSAAREIMGVELFVAAVVLMAAHKNKLHLMKIRNRFMPICPASPLKKRMCYCQNRDRFHAAIMASRKDSAKLFFRFVSAPFFSQR